MDFEDTTITVEMDIEDDIGNHFKADVTITINELRDILSRFNLDICQKE